VRRAALALGLALLLAPAAPLRAGPAAPDAPGRGAVDLVPQGPTVEERLAEIRRRVQRVLVYPPIARWRGLEGTTRLEFEIGADGRARGLAVARSSGSWLLDRAAERALRTAGELPYVWGRLSLPVRFALADAAPAVGEPAQIARTP